MHIHRKLAMESLNLTSKLSQKLNPIRACVFTNKIERSNDDYDLFQLSLHRSQLDHAYHDEYDTISKRNQEKVYIDYNKDYFFYLLHITFCSLSRSSTII